ncbi:nuclear distribution protein nudE homolog [Malaya genurostris]|uniref:nuclear distribution protein nudE homolog n=1 Tax=Malaya genurostris TaxID=325434 RepID=UPI0026F3CCC3|nr:nuclear distribution protein nudE homolog [Malaya genurostris]XP_058449909.1 nuclear distribution protein nudE homolog [Malaya genurostris]XP_058449910.1 nuclear distribution protein nudE homolog [Malaya genurostris]
MDQEKLFTSVEEECLYWKERCLKLKQERNDVQREFDDFTEESRQLEAELEMTVEQQEKKIRDLNQMVNQLRVECESYKRKVTNTENESNKIDADYKQLAKENEKFKVYIRELEQKNDDLERANRVASESVAEFESMLNQAYEKNALLELEVDEKERMQIKLQRLMDEARDLKQELKVRNFSKIEGEDEPLETAIDNITVEKTFDVPNEMKSLTSTNTNTTANLCLSSKLENINNNINCSKKTDSTIVALTKSTSKLDLESKEVSLDNIVSQLDEDALQQKLITERNGNIDTASALIPNVLNAPMAPSDRVSTLSIVADLLRRLDNMEAKLKAWKIRKPSSRTNLASNASHRHNHLNHHLQHHSQHQQSSPVSIMGGTPADSNASLHSIDSGDSCCNVQLHSYQPGMASIGTQTSQQQQIQLAAVKTELKTSK